MPFLGHIIRGRATANFPDQEDRAETPSVRPTERARPPSPSTIPACGPPRRCRLIAAGLCPLPGLIFYGRAGPNWREGVNPINPCASPQTKHPPPLGCPRGQYNANGHGSRAICGRCRR